MVGMSGASIIYRAHVPGRDLNRFLDRESVAVRTCARLRWRAHSDLTNAQTPPVTHRVAVLPNSGSVIASILPVWRKLRRTVELTQAPVLRIFSSPYRGRVWRLILNFGRAFGAGSLSSNALVQFLQEPASRVFHRFFVAPVLSSVPVLHVTNKSMETVEWRAEKIRIRSRKQQ
jgi:hypothetical protein